MFVNISNHPSSGWGEEQLESAREYGTVADLPFPNVNPEAGPLEVRDIAKELLDGVHELQRRYGEPCTMIHLVGEPTLTFAAVNLFLAHGFKVCTSTTERISVENADGTTTRRFAFVRFREYRHYGYTAYIDGRED